MTRAKDLKIRAGEWDTQTPKERLPYQERIVSRIFGHPDYKERSLANDVVSMNLFICLFICLFGHKKWRRQSQQ